MRPGLHPGSEPLGTVTNDSIKLFTPRDSTPLVFWLERFHTDKWVVYSATKKSKGVSTLVETPSMIFAISKS
jgi:hypothetical protein